MLLPVKQSFTKSNILIVKTAIMDLILDLEGKNIIAEHQALHSSIKKPFRDNPT